MPNLVSILCLTPQVTPFVEYAVTRLNTGQDRFHFHIVPGSCLPPPDQGQAYSFQMLDLFLIQEKQRLGARYLLGIMDLPNENNYFSKTSFEEMVCFITTCDWEYLSSIPTFAFVGYAIVRNLVTMLGGRPSFHEETRGCLFDFCAHKPDYSFKIRTADICSDCLDFVRTKLDPSDLDVIVILLERIRLDALGRGNNVEPTTRSQVDTVDRDYPFPIAYCFRSMQAELSYSRKWLKLIELYEVTIKYLAFVLLASLQQALGTIPHSVIPHLAGLKRPSSGHWHEACFALLNACSDIPNPIFVARFCQSVGRNQTKRARTASEQILPLRNATKGHGFLEEEQQYKNRYEQYLGSIQFLVEFIRPLARSSRGENQEYPY
jgi:hypothetical protein